ncbi:MAG TPA: ABC transporter permease, partial [Solirubrobacteraceae bacterium]
DLDRVLERPSMAHLMGTDEVGRDLLARVLHGVRVSMTIAVLAALAAAAVGTLVGVVSGTMGGKVDAVVMRITDVFASQNHFLFGILLLVLFRPALGGAGAVMLAVGLTHWPSLARIVRGELMSLRELPFISAAVGGGASRWRLARRHYLPHLMPAVGLAFVLTVPHAVFHESAYSFLGLGLPAHQASLGNILADGQRSLLAGGWWIALFPGLAILTAAMAIGTLAEYWREHLHPRWRSELEL